MSLIETAAKSAIPRAAPVGTDDDRAWLARFAGRHGRRLRALHVGNIANNAFLNAKFLRQAGVDAEVLCYDYYHVMGTPEWEEVDLRHPYGDDYNPRFAPEDLVGYDRPAWFIQGPLSDCRRTILSGPPVPKVERPPVLPPGERRTRLDLRAPGYRLINAAISDPRLRTVWRVLRLRRVLRPAVVALLSWLAARQTASYAEEFALTFPERGDRLRPREVVPLLAYTSLFREIFERYDIIQLYSTDPMFGWLAGNRPYVGFEHGTLRDFTLGDDPVHRLAAMGYRKADHVFITNGDCLEYAQKIGIERYSAMVHPIDVDQHRSVSAASVAAVRAEHAADILMLCPLRHSWAAKRTDIHLRALPLIRERARGRVRLVLIEWGEEVERSRELIRELGCSDAVEWIKPLPRIGMIRLTRAADVVLDQMALPHFGATAPQAMAAGIPVISSYVPESTRWIIEEPAPILPAFSPEEVCDQVMTALDPLWLRGYRNEARRWIDTHHAPRRVVDIHLRVYREILDRRDILNGHDRAA
jgi:glycosyltransferase involved in cell wall biosynthesis